MTRLFALLLALCTFLPASADAQDASRSDWYGTWIATDGSDTMRVILDDEITLRMRGGGENPKMQLNVRCLWWVEKERIRIETCTHMEAWSNTMPRDSSFVRTFAANSDAAHTLAEGASIIIGGARREGPALILRRDGDTLIYQRE